MRTLYAAGHVLTTGETELTAMPGAGLLVEDGRIVAVGTASELALEAEEVVDFGPECYLVPGLIDTHVHLALDGSPEPKRVLDTAGERELLVLMLQNARKLLSAGVTTARDLGAPGLLDQTVKAAVANGEARGPRLVTVTAPLTVTGGHCWFFGGECDGVDDVRRRVRQARRDGADAIKVMATGGFITRGTVPWRSQFTTEELEALVEEAHSLGLRVTAHAHGEDGIEQAILAGVDGIEHFSFVQSDGKRRENPAHVALAAQHGTYVCMTVSFAWALAFESGHFTPSPTARRLLDRGVRIAAGTDAGVNGAFHEEYVTGLEGLGALGMTNQEALLAATRSAAESLGLENEIGTLDAGKSADFLVVDGDPRDDLSRLRDPRLVVAVGEPYVPEFRSSRPWNSVATGLEYTNRKGTTP